MARCLTALTALEHPSFEVLVVDNTPQDPEPRQLAARFGARYLREPRTGLSRARNTGARAAAGGIVAFTDDDAVPDPSWLRIHSDALQGSALAATTGRVVPLHLETIAARRYAGLRADDLGASGFVTDMSTPGWFEMANFGGVGVGANIAFRRELFQSGWGFREDLGPGSCGLSGEEHYAFFDLIRSGHRIAYLPDAIVRHEPPATLDRVARLKRRILRGSSAYLVMLMVEERGYRTAALRYALGGLTGRRRFWRRAVIEDSFASGGELMRAALAGPAIYLRSRMRSSGK